MAKNKKKFNIKILLLAIIAAIFMVVLGAIFSLITGYDAKERDLMAQLVVWSVDVILSYTLSWLIFAWGKCRVKYINWIAWGLCILICTLLVIAITETFDLIFVAVVTAVIPFGGYLVALLKKNYYKDNKK